MPYDAVEAPVVSAGATGWDSRAETLTSLTIPNFQQNVVDNEPCIANPIGPNPGNPSDQMGSAASNPEFGVRGAIVAESDPRPLGLDEVRLLEDFWKTSGAMLLVKDEINTANGSRLSEKVAQPALFVLRQG